MDAHTRTTSALIAAITLAAGLLTFAPTGTAADKVERDHQGRTIHFDVKEPGVNTAAYAEILANAAHGDEISNVTITVTGDAEISQRCGSHAEACFLWAYNPSPTNRSEIVLPAWSPQEVEQVLLHEYAHHLDASTINIEDAEAFDGTPGWFAARNARHYLNTGQLDWMYKRGWDRALGEVFAEDYTVLHLGDDARHRIDWLGRPSRAVLDAMAADLGSTVAGIRGVPASSGGKAVSVTPSAFTTSSTFKGLARTKRNRVHHLTQRTTQQRITFTGTLRGATTGRVIVRLRCGARTLSTITRSARGNFRFTRTVPVSPCRIIVTATKSSARYTITATAR